MNLRTGKLLELLSLCGIMYFFNLYSTSTIKGRRGVLRHNKADRIWFTSYSPIFTVIVMLSGSTYTALQLVSSNVFGLNLLHCGLTKYELKRVFHLKLLNNVLLENVPQLFFLSMYTMIIGEMTESAWFSLIGSAVSVLGTTLTYFIERDQGNNINGNRGKTLDVCLKFHSRHHHPRRAPGRAHRHRPRRPPGGAPPWSGGTGEGPSGLRGIGWREGSGGSPEVGGR